MGNLGGGEVLVILLLALIVLGPERLPGVARGIGKVLGDIRRVSSGFQAEVRSVMDETGLNDLKDEITGKAPTPAPGRSASALPPAPVASPTSSPGTEAETAEEGPAEEGPAAEGPAGDLPRDLPEDDAPTATIDGPAGPVGQDADRPA